VGDIFIEALDALSGALSSINEVIIQDIEASSEFEESSENIDQCIPNRNMK
jgi:hypothetical protein